MNIKIWRNLHLKVEIHDVENVKWCEKLCEKLDLKIKKFVDVIVDVITNVDVFDINVRKLNALNVDVIIVD